MHVGDVGGVWLVVDVCGLEYCDGCGGAGSCYELAVGVVSCALDVGFGVVSGSTHDARECGACGDCYGFMAPDSDWFLCLGESRAFGVCVVPELSCGVCAPAVEVPVVEGGACVCFGRGHEDWFREDFWCVGERDEGVEVVRVDVPAPALWACLVAVVHCAYEVVALGHDIERVVRERCVGRVWGECADARV